MKHAVLIEIDRLNNEVSSATLFDTWDDATNMAKAIAGDARRKMSYDYPDKVYSVMKREDFDKTEYWIVEDGALSDVYWTVIGV